MKLGSLVDEVLTIKEIVVEGLAVEELLQWASSQWWNFPPMG